MMSSLNMMALHQCKFSVDGRTQIIIYSASQKCYPMKNETKNRGMMCFFLCLERL